MHNRNAKGLDTPAGSLGTFAVNILSASTQRRIFNFKRTAARARVVERVRAIGSLLLGTGGRSSGFGSFLLCLLQQSSMSEKLQRQKQIIRTCSCSAAAC